MQLSAFCDPRLRLRVELKRIIKEKIMDISSLHSTLQTFSHVRYKKSCFHLWKKSLIINGVTLYSSKWDGDIFESNWGKILTIWSALAVQIAF